MTYSFATHKLISSPTGLTLPEVMDRYVAILPDDVPIHLAPALYDQVITAMVAPTAKPVFTETI